MNAPGARLKAVLDRYGNFLREKELALTTHQPYLIRWVRQFLHSDDPA